MSTGTKKDTELAIVINDFPRSVCNFLGQESRESLSSVVVRTVSCLACKNQSCEVDNIRFGVFTFNFPIFLARCSIKGSSVCLIKRNSWELILSSVDFVARLISLCKNICRCRWHFHYITHVVDCIFFTAITARLSAIRLVFWVIERSY